MEILEGNKLLLFFAFVMPGFLALKAYQLKRPLPNASPAQQVVDATCYSFINYALLFGVTSIATRCGVDSRYLYRSVPFWILATTIFPVVWALVYDKLRTTQFSQRWLPHPAPDPWEYVFGGRNRYWIVATLKNGKKIGGRYGSASFASSAPAPEQLFLEEAWILNDQGGFKKPKRVSAGVMIWGSEISSMDFFKIEDQDEHVKAEQAARDSAKPEAAMAWLGDEAGDSELAERLPTGKGR
jgi:hypothetical protein